MTDHLTDLDDITNCMLRARIDASSDQWHLTERAVPGLLALADQSGESRFRAAADAAVVAARHLAQARDVLRNAGRLALGDGTSAQGDQP
jgi:hypothetical protein